MILWYYDNITYRKIAYSTNGQDNEKRFFDRNKKLDGKLVKKAVL